MHSFTPDIIPFPATYKSDVLSESEIATLKEATLRVLSEVGVHFPSKHALAIFDDHGADVDHDQEIVRLSPDLVAKAMGTAPRSFILAGREERFDLTLDGKNSYLSTDGCGVHVVDLYTRQRRASCKADVEMMAHVCDALPLISFFWPLVSAQDHGKTAPLHECHAGLTNTLKHVRGGTTVPPELAKHIVELATIVRGSKEALRSRPPICANICTISPLSHDTHGIETALVYAEAGIPISFMAMPTMGSTAPATPLGALVVGDAEVVSGMVFIQLAYPGAPVFHSIITSLMEPRTGGYIADPPAPVTHLAVQLAHGWGVPSLGGGSASSDAAETGWHSGYKAGMGAAQIPLISGEICGYMGLLDASMVLQPEQVILDHEICMDALDLFAPFEFGAEQIPFDLIKKVGQRSHYLNQKHTARHMRDFRYSPLLRKQDVEGNPMAPQDVAMEEFKRLVDTHQPEPLTQPVLGELDRVLASAESWAVGE